MENVATSLALNLSNQSNFQKSQKVLLSQMNAIVLLGFEGLEKICEAQSIPLRVKVSCSGDLSIQGLDMEGEKTADVWLYKDKKVSQSKAPQADIGEEDGEDVSRR